MQGTNCVPLGFHKGLFSFITIPAIASMKLQPAINKIEYWTKKWRIKTNQSKSIHITFIICNQTCSTVQMDNVDPPQKNEVKYLCMHVDRRLTWAKENS
jgi:hypothetical protein